MADSIRELIIKNIVTTLQGITTGAGYNNTIVSVQRPMPDGNTFTSWPMILVLEGEDQVVQENNPHLTHDLTVGIVFMTRINPASDSRSINEVLNSLERDVHKALMVDRHRGANALDTVWVDELPYHAEEGQPELARLMVYSIRYRHQATDPNTP